MTQSSATRFAVVVCLTLVVPASADAQPFSWNNFGSSPDTLWSTAANWSGGVAPTPGVGTALEFVGGSTVQGGYTTTVGDAAAFPGGFQLNRMVFGATFNPSGRVTITSAPGVGPAGVRFAGLAAPPRVDQNLAGEVVFADGPAAADLFLEAPLQFGGTGIGGVLIEGVIGDGGAFQTGLRIGTPAPALLPLFTGQRVTLAGANTFLGPVNLFNGNLAVRNAAALGAATNPLVIGANAVSPSFRFDAAGLTVSNPLVVDSTSPLTLTGRFGGTFAGPVSGFGAGGLVFANTEGAAAFTLSNTVGTAAPLRAVPVGAATTTVTLEAGGTATATPNYLFANAAFRLDNTAGNVTRLNQNASFLELNASRLELVGNPLAPTAEAVLGNPGLRVSGRAEFVLTPDPARPLSLRFSALAGNGAGTNTLELVTQGAGRTLGGTPGTAGNANLLIANPLFAPFGDVLPYAIARTGDGAGAGATFTRYDAARGLVPLDPAADYALRLELAGNAQGVNYRVPAGANRVALAGTTAVRSLLFESASGSPAGGIYAPAGVVLDVASGGLLTGVTGTAGPAPAALAVVGAQLDLGGAVSFAAPGFAHTLVDTVFARPVVASNRLVKSGSAALDLAAANPGINGITVNSGWVRFAEDAQLGAAGPNLVLNSGVGGGLSWFPSNRFGSAVAPSPATGVTIARPITLGPAGGAIDVHFASGVLQVNGLVGGPPVTNNGLIKDGPGVLFIGGVNQYAGGTTVRAGTLAVPSDAALGVAGTPLVLAGGEFEATSNFASARPVFLAGDGVLHSRSNTSMTLSGSVTSQTAAPTLRVSGQGVVTLTGLGGFQGAVTVGEPAGVGHVRPPATPAGRLVLADANGALPLASGFTVNSGGTLVLDNSVAVNNNRVGAVPVTLAGGSLLMQGSAGPVTEFFGSLTAAGPGGTVTLNPTSAPIQITAGEYAAQGAAVTLVRGFNIGLSPTDQTVRFRVAPQLAGGIVPSMVYGGSPTSPGEDFAGYGANGVERFTAYTPMPSSGSFPTAVALRTGFGPGPSGDLTLAALKITGSGLELNGFTMSLGGTPDQAGALLVTGSGGALTFGNLAFGPQPARVFVASGANFSLGAAVTGSGGFNKAGGGTASVFDLAGVTGGLTVSGGVLRLSGAAALPAGQPLTVGAGAVLDLSNFGTPAAPVAVRGLSGVGQVAIGGGAFAAGAEDSAFSGTFAGGGTLVKAGPGTLTLAGNSTGFNGPTLVRGGTLRVVVPVRPTDFMFPGPLGTGTAPVILGETGVATDATLAIGPAVGRFEKNIQVPAGPGSVRIAAADGTLAAFAGTVSFGRELRLELGAAGHGTGSVTFLGGLRETGGVGSVRHVSGQVAFHGTNFYSGGTTLEAGMGAVVGVGSNEPFGGGPVRFAVNGPGTATLRADNGPRTVNNEVRFVNASAQPVGFTGLNTLTLGGTVVLTETAVAATRTFDVTAVQPLVLAGPVVNGAGVGAVAKTGGGPLGLSGQSTFSGGLTLNAGPLALLASSAGPPGAVTSGPAGTGTLTINGGGFDVASTATVNNPVRVNGDFYAVSYLAGFVPALTLGGPTDLGGATRRVTVLTPSTRFGLGTFASPGQGPASVGGSGGIVKDGPGILVLNGTSSYTGPTVVEGGTLLVNGTTAAASAVTVGPAGTLGGLGLVNGPVTADGTVAPGNGPFNVNPFGVVAVTLNGTLLTEVNGGSSDLLFVQGTPVFGGASRLSVSDLGNGSFAGAAYTVLTAGTLAPGSGFAQVVGLPAGYQVVYNYGPNGSVQLVPVPEPVHLMAVAALALAWVGRRANAVGGRRVS